MNWVGFWRNQYGSILEISGQADGRIEGWFTSAVDGRIKDHKTRIIGLHRVDLISFSIAEDPIVAAWTGILRNECIETLWHVAMSSRLTAAVEGSPAARKRLDMFEAITTGADTFTRI